MQNTEKFSYDDLMLAYDVDMVNKELFPTVDDVKKELEKQGYYIVDEEIQYRLDEKTLKSVNEKYDGKDLLKPIGEDYILNQRISAIEMNVAWKYMGR